MNGTTFPHATGWLRDYPDFRDYSITHDAIPDKLRSTATRDSVRTMLVKAEAADAPATAAPVVDLRSWMSPVEDQQDLGACTAHAGVGLVEYYERRAFGRHIDASRLFLYKATRNLMHETGDTGAYLRTTMAALALFGVPPEEHWKYIPRDFDNEPSAFCYAFAQNYRSIQYYRLDPAGTAPATILTRIKDGLAAGLPSMFGFTVYDSVEQAAKTGEIPFPSTKETVVGGHAVVAAGYDDSRLIRNTSYGGPDTTGALLIRNSWGTSWGDAGYGWLPYEYVLQGLAVDWWSIIKQEWVDTGQFGVAATLQGMVDLTARAGRPSRAPADSEPRVRATRDRRRS